MYFLVLYLSDTQANMKDTKNQIIEQSFKLFLTNNYEAVTIADLEKAVGKTRGAIFYFFKNKEEIFNAVVDRYFIHLQNPAKNTNLPEELTLEQFIGVYLACINGIMSQMLSLSVINFYRHYFLLYLQASRIYPNFAEIATRQGLDETDLWQSIIRRAIQSHEIKPVNPRSFALLFRSCFLGLAFDRCLNYGLNTDDLASIYMDIYKQIKVRK